MALSEGTGAAPLRVLDLTVRYGTRTALAGVSADLPAGITGLLGANGAGKTTLMRVLAGNLAAQHGRVLWRGGAGGFSCGYMPQEAPRTALLSSLDYVRYLALLTGVPRREVRERARAALTATGLAAEARTRVSRLSGGMFRRLMLAAALVGDPEVLLLDEPTVGLDPIQREEMLTVLRNTGRERVTLLSSHLLEDVADVADALVILRRGEVAYQGSLAGLTAERAGPADPAALRTAVVALMRAGDPA